MRPLRLVVCVISSLLYLLRGVRGYRQKGAACLAIYSIYITGLDFVSTPGVFCTYFYNDAHRLRLEKLLYLEPPRSSNGFFKPLLDPDDGFNSETAERRFQN